MRYLSLWPAPAFVVVPFTQEVKVCGTCGILYDSTMPIISIGAAPKKASAAAAVDSHPETA
jgi:hypothetical protein